MKDRGGRMPGWEMIKIVVAFVFFTIRTYNNTAMYIIENGGVCY